MDFVYTSKGANAEPKLFWLFLSIPAGDGFKRLKEDAFLPAHVWDRMTSAEKQFVADTESKWLQRDPKVRQWMRQKWSAEDSVCGENYKCLSMPLVFAVFAASR